MIAGFDLTPAEKEVVLNIRANTLQDFARALLQWATENEMNNSESG
jgi:hypothetical protein